MQLTNVFFFYILAEIAPPLAVEEKLTPEILSCLYKNLTEAEREALEEAVKMKQQQKETRLLPKEIKMPAVTKRITDYASIVCSRYVFEFYGIVGKTGDRPRSIHTATGGNILL